MMDYIEECIGTGNFSEAQKIIKKSRNKFSERYYWTGITVLDIVKKYDGIIEFEYTEMFFQTVIMIEGE